MNNESGKINSFTDLYAWQEAHKLVLFVYKILKSFPEEEKYALTSQIRRAVISISSNIAEGFSRPSFKEKIKFYYISLGSVTELQNQLLIARDVGYIYREQFKEVSIRTITVHKLTTGLIKGARRIINEKHNS